MPRLIFAALLAFCSFASAQTFTATVPPPPCWPKQLGGTGGDIKTLVKPGAQAAGWVCNVAGKPTAYAVVWTDAYALKHPAKATTTLRETLEGYWRANVGNQVPESLKPLHADIIAAVLAAQPVQRWVVAASSAPDDSRPAYHLTSTGLVPDDGKVRVKEGTACECQRLQHVNDAGSTYCGWAGGGALLTLCRVAK